MDRGIATRNQNNQQLDTLEQQIKSVKAIFSKTCPLHQGNRFNYVSVDTTEQCIFKCQMCVTDENIQQNSLISIKQIVNQNDKTIFTNYPLTDREFTKQIQAITQKEYIGDVLKQGIENFFKDIRASIFSKLETIEKKMQEKAKNISDLNSEIHSLYEQMSEKKKLKTILIDAKKSFEEKNEEIKDLISKAISQDSSNQQQIRSSIEKVAILEKAIDFDSPNKIKESVLQQIDQINMFLVEDVAHFSQQLFDKSNCIDPDQNVSTIMKFVRNKFNQLPEESCQKFEEQLNQIKTLLSVLELPKVGTIYEKVQSLNSNQTDVLCDLIEEINLIQHDDNSELMEQVNPESILNILGNPTNYSSAEYLEEIKLLLNKVGNLLSLFQIQKQKPKTAQQVALNQLNNYQLDNLSLLALRINELTDDKRGCYLKSQTPKRLVQPNSYTFRNYIKGKISQFNEEDIDYADYQNQIDALFVSYPIFDLLPVLKTGKILPINFIKTKHKESNLITIVQNDSGTHLQFPERKEGQTVSDILDNNRAYSLKLRFNRPYGKTVQNGFLIGLIPDNLIDSQFVLQGNTEQGFYSKLRCGAKIVIKGDRLSGEELREVTKDLEFRWCVAKKQFYFSDSSYQNINQGDASLNPLTKYRFGIHFYNLFESDWIISITELKEIDQTEVSEFY